MKRRIVASELRAELARRSWRHLDLTRAAGISRPLVGLICSGMRPSERAEAAVLTALGPEAAERVTAEAEASSAGSGAGGTR